MFFQAPNPASSSMFSTYTNNAFLDIKYFGENSIIGGNVSPPLMQSGVPKDRYEAAKQCIKKAKFAPRGFIFDVWLRRPPKYSTIQYAHDAEGCQGFWQIHVNDYVNLRYISIFNSIKGNVKLSTCLTKLKPSAITGALDHGIDRYLIC